MAAVNNLSFQGMGQCISFARDERGTYRIIETDDIQVIFKVKTTRSIIFSDLDNTLITAKKITGSAPFWDAVVEKTEKTLGLERQDAIKKISKLFKNLNLHAGVKAVDSESPTALECLQKEGTPVVPFTARNPDEAELVFELVKEAGYSFEKTIECDQFVLAEHEGRAVAEIRNQMVFSGSYYSKGKVLELLIEKTNLYGMEIIMIDDNKGNLVSMKEVCEKLGITFTGIRYAKMDSMVQNFPVQEAFQKLGKFFQKEPELASEYDYLLQN